jgi:uncharacterized protein
MQASRYNIIVNRQQDAPLHKSEVQGREIVVYNTLRASLVVLNEDAYRDLLNASGPYADELKEAGLLCESRDEELAIQEQAFDRDRADSSWLALSIAPTYACNYQCPYCYQQRSTLPDNMGAEVIEGIHRFMADIWERDRYQDFNVQWYGGEPVLCLDLIERMSAEFRAFCEKRAIAYSASIITNASRISEDVARRLAACGVSHAMPTVDGCSALHNRRRVARDGTDSFALTLGGARNLRDAGVDVTVGMNLDKKSLEDYLALRETLRTQDDLTIYPSLLKDYRRDFGQGAFAPPDFDLYTREEYSHVIHDLFVQTPFDAEVLKLMLKPVRNFCRGQLENYFVIDANGDVCKCEGRIGEGAYRVLNVCEPYDLATLQTTDYNPLRDPLCRECAVLPLCKGQCAWDRDVLDGACHIIKFSIEDYVADYRSCFGPACQPVTVLAAPVQPEAFFAKTFRCDQPGESTYAGKLDYTRGDAAGIAVDNTIW